MMSALGQKQTCAVQNGMSALGSKADMCGAIGHVRLGPIAVIVPSFFGGGEQLAIFPMTD
jgi:hypothetical protein